jgi:hypothetical protein
LLSYSVTSARIAGMRAATRMPAPVARSLAPREDNVLTAAEDAREAMICDPERTPVGVVVHDDGLHGGEVPREGAQRPGPARAR